MTKNAGGGYRIGATKKPVERFVRTEASLAAPAGLREALDKIEAMASDFPYYDGPTAVAAAGILRAALFEAAPRSPERHVHVIEYPSACTGCEHLAAAFVAAAPDWMLVGRLASPETPEAGIDALRALSEAATPGPWEAEPLTGDGWAITGDTPEPTDGSDGTWSTDGYGLAVVLSREDAKFIPAAVNYVRARLASRPERARP